MSKSPDAFRTISEVADWLGIQAHVLRFWESKFTQVKPIKRAGGRRYYRPADMLLLGGIKKLLHDDGLTIKGVQKLLREEGMSHVSAMSLPLDDGDVVLANVTAPTPTPKPKAEPEAVVLPFEAPKPSETEPDESSEQKIEEVAAIPDTDVSLDDGSTAPEATPAIIDDPTVVEETSVAQSDEAGEDIMGEADLPTTAPEDVDAVEDDLAAGQTPEPIEPTAEKVQPAITSDDPATEVEVAEAQAEPEMQEAVVDTSSTGAKETKVDSAEEADGPEADEAADLGENDHPAEEPTPALPSFSRSTPKEPEISTDIPDAGPEGTGAPEPIVAQVEPKAEAEPAAPKPRDIGMPEITAEGDFHAETAMLTRVFKIRSLDATSAQQIQPLMAQLAAMRDRMAAQRGNALPKS